ncbi:DUF882 domain-containing protein [Acuticoccus sp.]|uniref:DUF882 domain-containing protein n=1 Tax=Acuticoccus sp. TaxID=1904378 RepID=UPI003B51D3A8
MALLLVSLVLPAAPAMAASRTLELYFTHTRESIKIVYKRNGSYVGSALRDLNRFLRDWRRNEATKMDPELFDLLWEMQQEFGGTIHVVSAYRSPATNSMLRSRSRGVAKNSHHMAGRAVDFFIKGANIAKLRAAGMKRQVGGVGYYPRSNSPFVHMDTGHVRAWPRMPRSELARLFPDGKTLHLPADGKPLKGYAEAQRLERDGKLASLDGSSRGGGLLAFVGLGRGGGDAEPATAPRRAEPARDPPIAVRTASLGSQAQRTAPQPSAQARQPTSDDDGEERRGLFRQLPSVSLGGLIGRTRRADAPAPPEPAEVQPVALPSAPLTSVAAEAPAVASEPAAPPPTPRASPAGRSQEDAPAAPVVVAALPPHRPLRPSGTEVVPAPGALAYAREDVLPGDTSPQSDTAALIPSAPLGEPFASIGEPLAPMGEPLAPVAASSAETVPSALTAPVVEAMMRPVTGASPALLANPADVSSDGFATLVAPDRSAAMDEGVLLVLGFLGSGKPIQTGRNDWLRTDRFVGTRITVFASPRT